MGDTRKIVRVFLGSPGDLTTERSIAKVICDEFNSLWASTLGHHVELVGWEDTVAAFGRAQEIINRDLMTCELFIGIVWKRWGTPPDKLGKYKSGFEEEFDISVKRRDNGDHLEISLFFKDIDEESVRDPGDQLKLVLEFKAKLIAGKAIYFETFSEVEEFAVKFRRALTKYVQGKAALEREASAKEQPKSYETPEVESEEAKSTSAIFPAEQIEFIQALLAGRGTSGDNLSPETVARTRLIASGLYTASNDRSYIQTHDANILYINRKALKLSDKETESLFTAALLRIDDENQPFWHWYQSVNVQNLDALFIYSTFAPTTKVRTGALKVLLSLRLPFDLEGDDRGLVLARWRTAKSDVRVAALNYLAAMGSQADIEWIRAEFDKNESATQTAALNALISVYHKISPQQAIEVLFSLQPASVSKQTAELVFSNASAISTDVIVSGLLQRSGEVRRSVAKVLFERNALSVELSRKLLDDDDYLIRLFGALGLGSHKVWLDDKAAKDRLVRKDKTSGFLSMASDEYIDKYNSYRLANIPINDLKKLADDETVYSKAAYHSLVRRQFKNYAAKLRLAISDQYASDFDDHVDELEKGHSPASIIEQTKGLKNYVTRKHTRDALEIICAKGGEEDINVVRQSLTGSDIEPSEEVFIYLRRFGDWSDIEMIVSLTEKGPAYFMGMDTIDYRKRFMIAASRALVEISKNRQIDLLHIINDKSILRYVLAALPAKECAALSDNMVLDLLRHADDDVRKSMALKLIVFSSKKRAKDLMDKYTNGENEHFYNVIHWIDLAVSSSPSIAKSVASLELSRIYS